MEKNEEEKRENKSKISRREFLRDAGLVVGGATLGSMAFLNACKTSASTATVTTTKTNTVTAGGSTVTVPGGTATATVTVTATPAGVATNNLIQISFTANGKKYTQLVDPSWDLQYFLHDIMGFLEIKTFCYRGCCGSCTVIMNGRPILTCMTLAVNADGSTIETANGIALAKHPIIDTYVKYTCMQCGYCTPGFVCTAKALLDNNPSPTTNEIIEALAGNLCRCGTYPQHILAVNAAAALLKGGS